MDASDLGHLHIRKGNRMTSGVFENAKKLPSGATFHRCALQVNPAHYASTFRGADGEVDERAYVVSLLDKCHDLGISVIAVTDHNHAGSVAVFREEAERRDITVFPGFEVASSEGIHVLCIYHPDTSDAELQRFLGQLDITTTEPSASLSGKSFSDLLECVRQQGGLTIAAHITQEKGLLHTLHGQARVKAWKDPNLLCVQIPGAVDDTPEDKRPILRNKNSDYRRDPGAADCLAVAVVNAQDVTSPKDLEEPSSSCWIKMSQRSLEGLRQAFLDPWSRIRLASDPVPDAHAEFRTMAWEGGFLDGCGVSFNENLNVLIGGRGTGKSTVIESLRSVLDLEPLGPEATLVRDGILRQVLRNGTRITLLVRVHRPAQRNYVIERTLPNASVVRDEAGQVLPLQPRDIIPRAQVFGQHEISELTKDPAKLTRLLDRFIGSDDQARSQKADLRQKLASSRQRIIQSERDLEQLEEKLAALPKLEETLKRFQEAGLEEKLKDKSLLVQEEQIVKTASARVELVGDLARGLRDAVPLDQSFLRNMEEQVPSAETFSPLLGMVDALDAAINQAADVLDAAVASAEATHSGVEGTWDARRTAVEAEYEKTLRALHKAKVDGEEFIRLRQNIEALRPLKRDRDNVLVRLAEDKEQRRQVVVAWEDAKAEEFRALEKAAKKVTRRLDGRVRVGVTFSAVRDSLFSLLKDRIGGRLSESLDTLRQREDLSLSAFAKAARDGKNALVAGFGLVAGQAERLAHAPAAVWMEVEELDLPPTTTLELNVASEGDSPSWQQLDDLSTGQKATAVLLLLLLDSDAPLVVDQPEDDLDNRFISESVVPRMREEKRRRQFIFATHNANIPVLGDAELIVGMSARGEADEGQGALTAAHMGAIDQPDVRGLVEELLEGGRRAFELRRLKYGF